MRLKVLKPGTYILAISGGVDSMVLLDLVNKQYAYKKGYSFIVAHFDHGIRSDSAEDKKLVQAKAEDKGLEFVYKEGKLAKGTSEAVARDARYAFLEDVQKKFNARAIITAHHQDDLIETAIINLIRGTRRKGLTALMSQQNRLRPLTDYPKKDLINYALTNDIEWREDSSNTDTSYLRNYVRLQIVPRLDDSARSQLLDIINNLSVINSQLDNLMELSLKNQSAINEIDRDYFNALPHKVAKETIAAWLRANGIRNFTAPTIEKLVVSAKTASPGQRYPILKGSKLEVTNKNLALVYTER